jgi:serine/threonine protein phosphatase 1
MTGNWKSVLRLDKNKSGKDFVCGDIHGCFEDLESELKRIHFNTNIDRLFCVGDLIDRGPCSEIASYYMACHWFFSVMGNHENMFFMGNIKNPERLLYQEDHIRNGGKWAYKMASEKRKAMLAAVDKLPLIILVGDVIIAHATLPEVESLEEIEKDPLEYLETVLWQRDTYPPVRIPLIRRVYVGHNIVTEPTQYGKIVNIDTGAFLKYCWGIKGKLTIMEIKEER